MGDLPVAAESVEASEEQPLPPLRIHHFFLWTIAVAGMMSAFGLVRRIVPGPEGDSAWLVVLVVFVPLSLVATTLGLGIYWRKFGHPFFRQPGHMLLIGLGVFASELVIAVAMLAYLSGPQLKESTYDVVLSLTSVIGNGLIALSVTHKSITPARFLA